MAYVSVPKDLTVVKSKIAFNLTKRQLICFRLGAGVAVPSCLLLKSLLTPDISIFLMIAIALSFFFLALYEKNGLPFEQVTWNMVRVKFLNPAMRPYQTENFYRKIQEEVRRWGTTTGTTQLRLGETKLDKKKESPKEKEVRKSIANPFPLPLKLYCRSEIWRFAYDGSFQLKESRVTEIE